MPFLDPHSLLTALPSIVTVPLSVSPTPIPQTFRLGCNRVTAVTALSDLGYCIRELTDLWVTR